MEPQTTFLAGKPHYTTPRAMLSSKFPPIAYLKNRLFRLRVPTPFFATKKRAPSTLYAEEYTTPYPHR
jgi:hypothetical protein